MTEQGIRRSKTTEYYANGASKKEVKNEEFIRLNYLISQFNMGWFGIPKKNWRLWGAIMAFFGFYLVIIQMPTAGILLALLGAMIVVTNG